MMLFDVKVSLLVDANDKRSAKALAKRFLMDPGQTVLPYNFLLHNAEASHDANSLQELRERQARTS